MHPKCVRSGPCTRQVRAGTSAQYACRSLPDCVLVYSQLHVILIERNGSYYLSVNCMPTQMNFSQSAASPSVALHCLSPALAAMQVYNTAE